MNREARSRSKDGVPELGRGFRLALFIAGAVGLAAVYCVALRSLPRARELPYAKMINALTVQQRNVTDAVSAVNFDYRGFDTLGEEFILFVSVMGTMVLLRQIEDDKRKKPLPDAVTASRDVRSGDAVRAWTLAMTGPTVLFGIYVVSHGQLTPGGGFQGGVILATAPLLIYLGEDFKVFRRVTSHRWVEIAESVGAGGYIVTGMIAWFYHEAFLTNCIPLGKYGELTSGGTVPIISATTGLEVTAGFIILLYAFLKEVLAPAEGQS